MCMCVHDGGGYTFKCILGRSDQKWTDKIKGKFGPDPDLGTLREINLSKIIVDFVILDVP